MGHGKKRQNKLKQLFLIDNIRPNYHNCTMYTTYLVSAVYFADLPWQVKSNNNDWLKVKIAIDKRRIIGHLIVFYCMQRVIMETALQVLLAI